ncbi:hypothetical protein MPDQ_006714 [Monascus purpureus]|uniref:Uncharacterized protein n=1 Tax=Monascus purpureus TaxID=5098 RepID=A0A507QTT6_MONPU|nr:hypothetical protein MPDQ_006714 [Monascus purpureus]BDD62290.1 hypothetical protein MAP00_007264 [Monascus purpureus]
MAGNNSSALSADSVLALAAQALRKDGGDASPNLKTSYEAIALIGHACMVAVGFRLLGLGEDHVISETSETPSLLPAEWNANSTVSFRYAHPQSSMQYLLKVSRLGNNAVVFALALGDDKTTSIDIPVKDYISESALPLSTTADLKDALKDVFISTPRLSDLIGLFRTNVIQRLAPGIHKEGYEDGSRAQRQEEQRQPEQGQPRRDPSRDDPLFQPARPRPLDDPLAAAPRPIPGDFAPPGFENEFEINEPPRGFPPSGFGGGNPLGIGDRDLYPQGLGPNDPFRGVIGPNRGGGSGGMHPTFDDPLFGGNQGGGDGNNPQVPPGSRYDPVGPGQGPPFGRRGPGGSGGFGGFGGFGGDII